MATKTIATKLVIEGEKETRAAISAINAEYRNLQAELKNVSSAFAGNQNSMDALQAQAQTLSATQEQLNQRLELQKQLLERAQQAQEAGAKATENARAALEDARRELAEYKEYGDESAEALQEYADAVTAAEKALRDCERAQAAAGKTVSNYSREVNLTQAELNDLNREIEQNERYLKEAEASSDGCASSIDGYGKAVKQTAEAAGELSEQSRRLGQESGVVTSFFTTLAATRLPQFLEKTKDALVDCAKTSIEFESAITGVYKTVDADAETLDRIAEGVTELSLRIPATASDIAGVAENAGQLGIAAEDILSFTETMIGLGEATNVSADEAASSLAKFANVTGMTADNYERLGSVVVGLGNNFATTEADIIAMGTNIASAGSQIGLTEDQIMGMAAALSSVGLEAQAGGTAISRLLIQMQTAAETGAQAVETVEATGYTLRELEMLADTDAKAFKEVAHGLNLTSTELKAAMSSQADLENFAKITGMTADEFARAFGEDAAGTVSRFFAGLGSGSESAIAILEEMGVTETRLRDTMLRLANANDVFDKSLEIAGTAWKQNTALADEAGKRYATTESKVQMLKNSFTALQVEIGDRFTPALNAVLDAGSGLTSWADSIISEAPWIVNVLGGITTGFLALAAGISAVKIATEILIPVWKTFAASTASGPLIVAAAALGALVTVGSLVADAIGRANEQFEEMTVAARDAKDALDGINQAAEDTAASANAAAQAAEPYIARLSELEQQSSLTNDEQQEYAALIEQIHAILPDVNLDINEQTGRLEGGTAALYDNIAAWREAAVAQALYGQRQDLLSKQADVMIEKTRNQNRLKVVQAEIEGRLAEAAAAITAIYDGNGKAVEDWGVAEWNTFQQMTEDAYALQSAYWDAQNGTAGLHAEQSDLKRAIEEADVVIGDYQRELDTLGDVENTLTEAGDDAAESQEGLAKALSDGGVSDEIKAVAQRARELAEAYNEAYKAAAELVDKSSGLFEDMSARSKASLEDMTKNEQSRATFYTEYSAALTGALDAVPESMRSAVLATANMSTESLAQLQAIANGSDEEIEAITKAFEATQTAQQTLKETIAQAAVDFEDSKNDIVKAADDLADELRMYDEMYAAGEESARGYIDGLYSQLGDILDLPELGTHRRPPQVEKGANRGGNITINQSFDSTATPSEVRARSEAAIEAALR